MPRTKAMTVEELNKIKESLWGAITRTVEGLSERYDSMDAFLKAVDGDFSSEFPKLDDHAKQDYQENTEPEDQPKSVQIVESLKLWLKALSSPEKMDSTFLAVYNGDISFVDSDDVKSFVKKNHIFSRGFDAAEPVIAGMILSFFYEFEMSYSDLSDEDEIDDCLESVTEVAENTLRPDGPFFDTLNSEKLCYYYASHIFEAYQKFNAHLKVNMLNVQCSEEMIEAYSLKIPEIKVDWTDRETSIEGIYKYIEKNGIGVFTTAVKAAIGKAEKAGYDDGIVFNGYVPTYDLLAFTKEGKAKAGFPVIPELKPQEKRAALAETHRKEMAEKKKREEEQRQAEEEQRQQEEAIEKDFARLDKRRESIDSVNPGLDQYALHHSDAPGDYDHFRFDDKKRLEAMSRLYREWLPNDPEITPILENMEKLSAMNVTAYEGYEAEGMLMQHIARQIEECRASLEQQQEALHTETVAALKVIPDGNGGFRWPTEEEIKADSKLKALDEKLGQKQQALDKRMTMLESMAHFVDVRKNGELMLPLFKTEKNMELVEQIKSQNEELIKQGKKPREVPQLIRNIKVSTKDFERPKKNTDKAREEKTETLSFDSYYDASHLPLFPHQPSPEDARQGYLGDCYFIATLSAIAQHHPEKIREMMVDNEDGTVTVKLFGNTKKYGKPDENGYRKVESVDYFPVYVTVDKIVPTTGLGNGAQMAHNCVWINCLERALAASGLFNTVKKNDAEKVLPVPEDTAVLELKYNEIKEVKEKIAENDRQIKAYEEQKQPVPKKLEDESQELSDKLEKYTVDYPWLFADSELVKWPSFQSIVGGQALDATEILLGPDMKREIDELHNCKEKNTYINLKPKTPEQLCAILLANETGKLETPDFDVPPRHTLDLSLPQDKLFEEAFRLSDRPQDEKAKKEAKTLFDSRVRELSAYLERNGIYEPTTKELVDAAGDCFVQQVGLRYGSEEQRYLKNHTLLPLVEKPYNKAQVEIYEKMEECLKMHLPVSANTSASELLPSPHEFTITDVYMDEQGHRMVKLRNPWGGGAFHSGVITEFKEDGTRVHRKATVENGEFVMELKDLVQEIEKVTLTDTKSFIWEPELPTKTVAAKDDAVDLNTVLSYTEAMDNVCKAFASTHRRWGASSDAFEQLNTQVKTVREKLPLMIGKSREELTNSLKSLTQKIEAYEAHCKKKVVDNGRRRTKVKAVKELKEILAAAEKGITDPADYRKDLAKESLAKNLDALDKRISDDFAAGDMKKVVNEIALKLHLRELQAKENKLSLKELDKEMQGEDMEAAIKKTAPLVADILSRHSKEEVTKMMRENTVLNTVEEKMSKNYPSLKSRMDAVRSFSGNVSKMNKAFAENKVQKNKVPMNTAQQSKTMKNPAK